MKGFIKCALIIVGLLCIFATELINAQDALAGEKSSWIANPPQLISQYKTSQPPGIASTCSGSVLPVILDRESSSREACVYGDPGGLRLARYYDASNGIAYGVAYANDSKFVTIRGFCTGLMRCVYSQSEDILVMESNITAWERGSVIIGGFSQYLKRYSDTSRYYQFEYPDEYHFFGPGNGYKFSTGSIAISPNGKWALIELKEFGIAKLDLRTLEYRRIAAYDDMESPTPGSLLELSISHDGTAAIVSGRGFGVQVYEIDTTCGDIPDENMSPYFIFDNQKCGFIKVDMQLLLPGFQWAVNPRFSLDGQKLSVYVGVGGVVKLVTISPKGIAVSVNPLYIAFGDSFTSGEGETDEAFYLPSTNTNDNRCHVSLRSYPFYFSAAWEIATRNVACSGSRTSDVLKVKDKLLQESPATTPSFISVGVGGNDINLVGKLKSCLGPGTCEWAQQDKRMITVNEIKGLLPKIVGLISEVREDFSGVPLFLMGYPEIISSEKDAKCSLALGALLSAEEREYMNETIRYLNSVLKSAAAYAKTHFVEVGKAFEGQRLCEGGELTMNTLRHGNDIAPIPQLSGSKFIGSESFHPTPYGHGRIANAADEGIREFWRSPHCETCANRLIAPEPPEYWLHEVAAKWADTQFISGEFLGTTFLDGGGVGSFRFPIKTFARGTNVLIELHSKTHTLGTFRVSDDGSLTGTFDIPSDVEEGYHTVHAIGVGFSGEKMSVYQTVFVKSSTKAQDVISTNHKTIVDNDLPAVIAKEYGVEELQKRNKATGIDGGSAVLGLSPDVADAPISSKSPLTPSVRDKMLTPTNAPLLWGTAGVVALIGLILFAVIKMKRMRTVSRGGD